MPYDPESIVRNLPMKATSAFEDWDTAVDLYRQNKGSINDMAIARQTIFNEAKRQLMPEELVRNRGNVNAVIDLVQRRIRPEEAGMVKGAMTQAMPNIVPGSPGQIQNASEIARGQPLLKLFNDLSKVNTPQSDAQMIDVGKKMLADPKYQDQWGSVRTLLDIMQRGAAKVGPALASQAPKLAAAATIPLHGMAGLIMPRLKDTFSLTNPKGSQMSL